MLVPPVETVYQAMVLPVEVALSAELAPQEMVDGLAVTEVGVARGATVTVTATRGEAAQPDAVQVKVTWPLPLRAPCVCVVLVPLE